MSREWLLWQLADSAFPIGGFAHSNGLEAAWQQGEIQDAEALGQWLEASLHQFGYGSLPFMTATHAAPHRFAELDQLCDCFLVNHVANRASRLQGKALLATASRIFDLPGSETGPAASASQDAPTHFAPAFGAVTGALKLERQAAARLFMFCHLRGALASAVRLGIIGSLHAQALQHRVAARCEQLLTRFLGLSPQDAAQSAPLLEIWQGSQDRLYSRLFQS